MAQAGSADIDFKGGTTAEIESGLGFNLGVGYHFTDRLRFGSTFTFDQKDYTADVASADPGVTYPIKGDLDTMSLMLDVAYTFLTGPVTPYVVGGVGWAWVDTNVATEPPEIGCWWHPWWGYICTSWQDTKTADGLAYEVGVGMRYDFSDTARRPTGRTGCAGRISRTRRDAVVRHAAAEAGLEVLSCKLFRQPHAVRHHPASIPRSEHGAGKRYFGLLSPITDA